MLKYSLALLLLVFSVIGFAQVVQPSYPQVTFPTYYWQKSTQFQLLPNTEKPVLFIGDSLTDGGEWSALFENENVLNFGISGETSAGIINRMPEIVKRRPSKIFLMIGINDLSREISVDSIFFNTSLIIKYLKENSPGTEIFVQSVLPVNDIFKTFTAHTSKRYSIEKLNLKLSDSAEFLGYQFLNLYPSFVGEKGRLNADFTNDGLHLTGAGYILWKNLIYPHLRGLEAEPALIPRPKQLTKGKGAFPIFRVKSIYYQNDSLFNEAAAMKQMLSHRGISVSLNKNIRADAKPAIRLDISEKYNKDPEAYHLHISAQNLVISSAGKAGIYYGLQTLIQLMRGGDFVEAVDIEDSPAFKWRGYMVDVGRNYQSIALLKTQIDKMAFYKLNVFHLHLTEDIAWRLEIKRYPELTRPEFMERNKGMYYTQNEIKDLISYAKARHILLVPEIDMPGHSAAFKRAMKTDMQSDSGLAIVKNILKEICETYDFPFIHIGADEVKITNKDFLPSISAFLKSLNKKVIGWEPGGNFAPSTIRQLWMDDAAVTSDQGKIQYIDSRHLYLNHMDPLESVVTIFNRQLAGVDTGSQQALGATLCLWPDRAVEKQEDLISMNGVFPAMLAFAERCWLGNGYKKWVASVNANGQGAIKSFSEFEGRLMDHKEVFFKYLHFPYINQSSLKWQLYGPYANEGKLETIFDPERSLSDIGKPSQTVSGGTIVLRHWWAPKIEGVLKNPKENTTWYAVRKIWSESDTLKNFWIGFNNFSRSQATDSPPLGQWDTHHSQIWINGEMIAPPNWLHAGQHGNLEVPLSNEGYEFRSPAQVRLRKGWNTILVKAPIGAFTARNWNNPEKWMFTCVEL